MYVAVSNAAAHSGKRRSSLFASSLAVRACRIVRSKSAWRWGLRSSMIQRGGWKLSGRSWELMIKRGGGADPSKASVTKKRYLSQNGYGIVHAVSFGTMHRIQISPETSTNLLERRACARSASRSSLELARSEQLENED